MSGSSNYRIFFQTSKGIIDNIYYMPLSSSTTVIDQASSSYSLVTNFKDYSSNWYLTNNNIDELNTDYANIVGYSSMGQMYPEYITSSSLYSSIDMHQLICRRGFTSGSFIGTGSRDNIFYLYDSNFSTASINEASSSIFYKPFIPLDTNPSFTYGQTSSVQIDIEEVCFTSGSDPSSSLYGFNIYSRSNDFLFLFGPDVGD
jgi:hypothetical protein